MRSQTYSKSTLFRNNEELEKSSSGDRGKLFYIIRDIYKSVVASWRWYFESFWFIGRREWVGVLIVTRF